MSQDEGSSGKVKEKKAKSTSSKPKKTKKTGSSSTKKTDSKGKTGPEWKQKFDALVITAQVQATEVYTKFQNNAAYRQKLLTYGAMVLTALLLIAVLGKGGRRSTQTLRVSSSLASHGGSRVSLKPKGPLALSKREREKLESGFDVSGSDLLSVKRRFGTREEYEKAQLAARGKLSSKDEACFNNMPVQVRRDSPKFTVYQPRKVFDFAVLQKAHKSLGWTEEPDLKKASLALKGVPRVVFRQLKEGKQYYDMVASLGRIGSKKKTQLSTLRNHVRKFKCTFESLHIQPRSYDMNRPSECNKFFAHEDKGKMWILKSCNKGEGSKGMGIKVVDDLSETRNQYGTCQENAFNYVAQEYIEQPFLIFNRKFDMRAYLFVASTKPYVVYFNPGYIRRSLAEYKPTSTARDDVLTNYHVQMTREDFSPGDAMWDFPQFVEYLKQFKYCEACGDVEIQLAKISRLVFDAGRPYYKRWSGSFQLVGLDFMLDANLNLQFIEGNVSPGIGNHGLKWKREKMADLVQIMYEQVVLIHERPNEYQLRIGDRVYGKYGHYWELVINEHHEKCNKANKFDPCQELKVEGVEEEPEDAFTESAADAEPEDSGSADDDDGED